MAVVSMKELLEAGVHFGLRTRRWNPKMRPYIFERSGVRIDLHKPGSNKMQPKSCAYSFAVTASVGASAARTAIQ